MNSFKDDKMIMKVEQAFKYEGTFSNYHLPYEIGCFSLDAEGKYRDDGHQMKYLWMPENMKGLYMDLNEGFREYIYESEDSEFNYNLILRWILDHQDLVKQHFRDPSSSSPKIDFVLFRGPLMAVSSTLYENKEEWVLHAMKFRSAIYIARCDFRKEQEIERTEMATAVVEASPRDFSEVERQRRMMSWGYKFEQYMVSDTMHVKPNTSVPVNENEKYLAVFKGKFGGHRLLYSTEYDGVDPHHLATHGCDPTSPLRYIELKTSRVITTYRQRMNFCRYKLRQWYLQSFFGGVPQVICGFRDDNGIVRELEIFNVRDIPKLANAEAKGKCFWSPSACINFTCQFLDYVKQCVTKENIVYEFYWEPGSNITCEELDKEAKLLPDWYTSKVTVF